MELATPQGLAALIRRQKESLLASWEAQARALLNAHRTEHAVLRDHLPLLLDELARELEHPTTSRDRLAEFSSEHGANRYSNGFDLDQVVDEYKLLRSCLFQAAEANGLYVVGESHRVINELIDEGVKSSIQAYVERRNGAESKRREEYLKFLVHDLRSPLSAIFYAILLMEREFEKGAGNERIQNIQSVIKRNIEQMQALIAKVLQEENNIKTAPNIEVSRAPCALATLVESAMRGLDSLAAASQTALVNEVPRELIADVDRILLERVFQNLLSNAIDNTPQGRVAVQARGADANTIECMVQDNGRGIPEEIKDRIFDKFVTASRQHAGIGLGLPIAKRIIEAHGGTIAVESGPSKGTTVRFTLPRAAG